MSKRLHSRSCPSYPHCAVFWRQREPPEGMEGGLPHSGDQTSHSTPLSHRPPLEPSEMRAPQTFTFCIPCLSGPHKPPLFVPQPAAPIPDVGPSMFDVGIRGAPGFWGALMSLPHLLDHKFSWNVLHVWTVFLYSHHSVSEKGTPLLLPSEGRGAPSCLTRQKPLPRWRCSLSTSFKENICYFGRNLGPLGELRAFPSKDMIPTCGHGVILEKAAQG